MLSKIFNRRSAGAATAGTSTTTTSTHNVLSAREGDSSPLVNTAVRDFTVVEPTSSPSQLRDNGSSGKRYFSKRVPKVSFAAAQVEGTRHSLEDFVHMSTFHIGKDVAHLMCCFDGHGTDEAAQFVLNLLPSQFHAKADIFATMPPNEWEVVIKEIFAQVGDAWLSDSSTNPSSGSCCVIALIRGADLVVANLGDCRAIISDTAMLQITTDHRPSNPIETSRIVAAGGFIMNGRVNNVLAPSRAFGDADLRVIVVPGEMTTSDQPPQPAAIIIHEPSTAYIRLRPTDGNTCFAVLASDGVFDVMNNDEVHTLIRDMLKKHPGDVEKAATILAEVASSKNADDVSCIVVRWKF